MKISVEMKTADGVKYNYVLFEDATAVYVETYNGLTMRQDKDLPGYRITEVEDEVHREEH